jgi:hypothetical protein
MRKKMAPNPLNCTLSRHRRSDSEPDFPEFRMFDIESLSNITILEGEPQFPINDKYNPEYDGYKNVIAKV